MDEEQNKRKRRRLKVGSQASLEDLISVVDYFANLSYQCIGIMDYNARRFMYISLNLRHLFKIASVNVRFFDYRDFKGHVAQSEVEIIEKAFDSLLTDGQRIGISHLEQSVMSCDFHLYTNIDDDGKVEGESILLHQKISPISFTPDGRVKYVLFALCFSPKKHVGPILVLETGHSNYYRYDETEGTWHEELFIELDKIKKEIIRLSAQGKTTPEIASMLCRSTDSIKAHKSLLYKRLDVDNMVGVIFETLNNGLL